MKFRHAELSLSDWRPPSGNYLGFYPLISLPFISPASYWFEHLKSLLCLVISRSNISSKMYIFGFYSNIDWLISFFRFLLGEEIICVKKKSASTFIP